MSKLVEAMHDLSHIDEKGRAKMVDVSDKPVTRREARAAAQISMKPETLDRILRGSIEKGEVLTVARVAGIMAAKRTSDLIPMCHPLNINSILIEFRPDPGRSRIEIEACVRIDGKTGVEMEALTAVSVAALTIYDMCKAIDRGMTVGQVQLLEKSGGKSGHYVRGKKRTGG
jgi:cyclic pyranopterin phosphate synthase